MKAGASDRLRQLFFSRGEVPTGSVNEYFSEVSNGKISMDGEVLGPYTLNQHKAYYAHGCSGFPSRCPEPNSKSLAFEAIMHAVGKTNFSKFDNDKGGAVRTPVKNSITLNSEVGDTPIVHSALLEFWKLGTNRTVGRYSLYRECWDWS